MVWFLVEIQMLMVFSGKQAVKVRTVKSQHEAYEIDRVKKPKNSTVGASSRIETYCDMLGRAAPQEA